MPEPFTPTDVREIMAYLSLIADTNWPGHRGGKLVVRTGSGKVTIPIPPWRPTAPKKDDNRGR